MSERVGRWGVALVGALTLVSVGLLAAEPSCSRRRPSRFAYVLYGAVARVPPGASLRAERVVETGNPTPGEAVDVALTVTNDGDAALTDVRIVDGVPGELHRRRRLAAGL